MAEEQIEVYESKVGERSYARGPFAGLTPNVIRMGIVSFFTDVASEMLYPLIPIFLTLVLGVTPGIVGIVEGCAEATASLLRTVSGRLSDLSGKRRPYVFLGYSISAIAKPLIALAQSMRIGWPLVLFARVADRFGKGVRTSPRDALLADSVDARYRGRAFGWHRAMDTMGAVIGPLLTLALVYYFVTTQSDLSKIFLWSFIPGLLGALMVLLVRDRVQPPKPRATTPSIRFQALPPPFRAYLIAWGVFAIANSSDAFLLLRATQLLTGAQSLTDLIHGTDFRVIVPAIAQVILLYTLYNVVYAAASPWLGNLSDKLGRKQVLAGGLLVFALVYLGFALAQPWMLWGLFAVYGVYIAATDGVGKALAVDQVPQEIRASALGLLGTVSGVAALLASIVAGQLWDLLGPWAAFAYGALGAVAGAALLARLPAGVKEG